MLKDNFKTLLGKSIVFVITITIFALVIARSEATWQSLLNRFLATLGMTEDSKPVNRVSEVSASDQSTILMTEKGFVPEIVKIKAGTKVIFVNKDKVQRWPASDLHPTHTIYPEFDPKQPIPPGQEWSFIFDRVGSWNFHDHLSPLITGKVIVE